MPASPALDSLTMPPHIRAAHIRKDKLALSDDYKSYLKEHGSHCKCTCSCRPDSLPDLVSSFPESSSMKIIVVRIRGASLPDGLDGCPYVKVTYGEGDSAMTCRSNKVRTMCQPERYKPAKLAKKQGGAIDSTTTFADFGFVCFYKWRPSASPKIQIEVKRHRVGVHKATAEFTIPERFEEKVGSLTLQLNDHRFNRFCPMGEVEVDFELKEVRKSDLYEDCQLQCAKPQSGAYAYQVLPM